MFVFFDASEVVKHYDISGIYTLGRAISSANRTKN